MLAKKDSHVEFKNKPAMMGHISGKSQATAWSWLNANELDDGADVVLGSRALGDMLGGGMPYYKWFGNRVLTFMENIFFNTHISSFHCGYKACNKKTVNTLDYKNMTSDFHFDTEFLVKTVKNKLNLAEVPITTIYYNDGVSNVKVIKYTLSILKFMFAYRLKQIKNYFK